MLRQDADDLSDRGRHRLENILEAGTSMGRLIDDLAAYTRIGMGALRREPVSVPSLVDQVRVLLAQRLEETDGTLICVDGRATPVADPTLMERILLNLVDNALTYRDPAVAPRVVVNTCEAGEMVAIVVADNGCGIPAESHEKIFSVFTRLALDEDPGHTGTGLATVRRSARAMGGEVMVTSERGAGSTFTVLLPGT